MRQMVLNHASVVRVDEHQTSVWLKDMALGMKLLIETGVTSLQQGFRMSNEGCAVYYSMLYGDSSARRNPATREEIEFLTTLGSRVPLLGDADNELIDRISSCQETTLPPEDGKPLLFCVFTDGIAVGFPSNTVWDRDEVSVRYEEILPDENFEEAVEAVDNLTRSIHAPLIHERHMATLRQLTNPDAFWNAREEAFTRLKFLPRVKGQLNDLNSTARCKVVRVFDRMENGNRSNVKGVGEGVSEFRINFGPGYRIYFGEDGNTSIILLCGTKKGQDQDIQLAHSLWQNYKQDI